MGQALVGPLGSFGPPWALVGPLGPLWAPFAPFGPPLIASRTPPDRFIYKKAAKIKNGISRSRDIALVGGTNALAPYVPGYIYMYI